MVKWKMRLKSVNELNGVFFLTLSWLTLCMLNEWNCIVTEYNKKANETFLFIICCSHLVSIYCTRRLKSTQVHVNQTLHLILNVHMVTTMNRVFLILLLFSLETRPFETNGLVRNLQGEKLIIITQVFMNNTSCVEIIKKNLTQEIHVIQPGRV